jgi:drug/metabolite transporter (DMT)-like permease
LTDVSPPLLTVIRFALAAALLVPLALARRGLLRALATPTAALLGLTGVAAYYGLQNLGLLYTTAGTAALLQAVIPVATAVLSFVLLRERPEIGTVVGLALATVGVVVASNTGATFNIGALLIAAGAVAYAVYTVVLRQLEAPRPERLRRMTTDPVLIAAATAVWGLVFLLPWQIWELAVGQSRLVLSAPLIVSTLYLGLFASGATLLLWTYGARRMPAITSGILTAAIPALGYGFALIAGEEPTWNKTVGGLLALLGVGVAIVSSRRTNRAGTHQPDARTLG